MATLRMEPSAEVKAGLSPAKSSNGTSVAAQHTQEFPGLGSIASVRKEIDDVLADMNNFHKAEPDLVMAAVSAHGARLVEIIVRIQRIEVIRREWKPVREEADKVLGELKSQFTIASRLIAIRQMDLSLSGGQV